MRSHPLLAVCLSVCRSVCLYVRVSVCVADSFFSVWFSACLFLTLREIPFNLFFLHHFNVVTSFYTAHKFCYFTTSRWQSMQNIPPVLTLPTSLVHINMEITWGEDTQSGTRPCTVIFSFTGVSPGHGGGGLNTNRTQMLSTSTLLS